ncbi:MAG: TolC family protein [Gemmatimonadetes bacterium]|nr:TolC family protein [Gemmatimonadota bacterium]
MVRMLMYKIAIIGVLLSAPPAWSAPGEEVASHVRAIESGVPVEIDVCVRVALALNPSLQASSASVGQSEKAILQGYANYLPTVTADFQAFRTRGNSTDNRGTFDADRDRFGSSVSIRQNFFTYSGYKDIGRLKNGAESARARHEAERQLIVEQVKNACYEVLKADDLLDVAVEKLKDGEGQLKLAEKRKEVGAGTKADVLKAQAQVESNRLENITAEKNRKSARANLLSLLGLDVNLPINVKDPVPIEAPIPSFDDILDRALANRPDLLEDQFALASANDAVGATKGEWYPNLSGSFSVNWGDEELTSSLWDESRRSWTAGLFVNVPLFDAGRLSRIRQNRASVSAFEWELERNRQAVALELKEALLTLEESRKRIGVADRNIEAAEEDLRVSQGKYQHGLVPLLDVIQAQVALAEARSSRVEAGYAHLAAWAALDRAVGGKD